MTDSRNPVLFYPPAQEKLSDIWVYSSRWGEQHADDYVERLYQAIMDQRYLDYHRPFPKPESLRAVTHEVYFFLWRYKSHTPSHSIFYRLLSGGNIGVIDIIGPGQNRESVLHGALERIADDSRTPNAETRQAINEARSGEDLTSIDDFTDFVKKI